VRGHSITYRIALGRHAGRKAFALQTEPAAAPRNDDALVKAAGSQRAPGKSHTVGAIPSACA